MFENGFNLLKNQYMKFSAITSTITSTPAKKQKIAEYKWWKEVPDYYTKGKLTKQEFEHFFTEGYVLKENLLDVNLLDQCLDDLNIIVDKIAYSLQKEGKIKNIYQNRKLDDRVKLLEKDYPNFSVIMHKYGILQPGYEKIWGSEPLLDAVGQILGPETDIGGNPIWNHRIKLPNNSQSIVPFHQDNAYFDEACWEHLIVVAWIPLINTNADNGTLQVLKKGQKKGITVEHTGCWKDTWYVDIPDETIEKDLGVELNNDNIITPNVCKGSVLFLSNLLPHRSSNNISNDVRWSLDLRFNDFNAPSGYEKPNILLRKAKGSISNEGKEGKETKHQKIDWESWARLNRHESLVAEEIDLTTTIHGPWMDKWKITNENRHTQDRKNYHMAKKI